MTQDSSIPAQMPSAEHIAEDALARLTSQGYRSQVMSLPNALLWQVGKQLATPGIVHRDIHRWLTEQPGGDAVEERAFYRFVQRFEETFKIIWGEYASNLIAANLHVDEQDVAKLTEFSRKRALEHVAKVLISAHSPADLKPAELNTIVNTIRNFDRTQYEREHTQIKMERLAQLRDAALLDAKLKEQRIKGITERLKALEAKVEKAQNQMAQGKGVDPSFFRAIREELIAMAAPGSDTTTPNGADGEKGAAA